MGDNASKECSQLMESERRLNNMDQTLREFSSRIGEVETRTIVYNEQIKMIFNTMEDIKQSLKELQAAVNNVERRPADLSQKIFIGVLTSMVTALLMLGLKYL